MDDARWRLKAYGLFQFSLGILIWVLFAWFGAPGTFSPSAEAARMLPSAGTWAPWLLLIVLFAASCAANYYKFWFEASQYYISFDIAFAVATLVLVSPFAGAGVAVLTTGADYAHRLVVGGKRLEDIWHRFLTTAGNRLIRFGLAWGTFLALGGDRDLLVSAPAAWRMLVAFAVYFLSNNLFFLPEEIMARWDLKAYFRESYTVDLGYSFVICTLGYFLGLVAVRLGVGPFVIFGAFTVMATYLFSRLTGAQRELQSKVEDLTVLSRATAAASSDLDVMPMVESFTRSLARHLPADGIGVIFYQRYATTIYLVQVEGDKSRSTYLPEERRFQYDQLPLSEPSRRLGERLFEFLQPLETAPFMIPPSVFGLPLVHGGEPFGGIVVYSYDKGVPLEKKAELLELCAQSLVVGLENCFLHLQAIQDPLTGLYNRSYFLYRLEEELSFSARHRAPFALMMLDLDDFKAVNDHLGHATGDQVLRRIGDILRRETRREDVPARYGGDEFIILLLGCQRDAALDKVARIRKSLATRALPKENAAGLVIGCSGSLLHSDDLKGEQDIPTLLRRLDDALYKAKHSGKNRVVEAS